ncbi:MAG: hypothetical protein IAG13_31980 [Deltaproteobacteria bacterium]|nr:hypothetical protein [Nannocystaceae bacterium]
MNYSRACLAVIPFVLLACDLTPKDIGDEPMTTSGGGGDGAGSDSGSDSGGPCVDGDARLTEDQCNICTCSAGEWECTLKACGDDPQCEDGDVIPAFDGCNDCSCEDGQWACSERACAPPAWFGDALQICDPGAPQDSLDLYAVNIGGDTLSVNLGYGGGCETHELGLCWDGSYAESAPVQVDVFIAHEDHGDPCEAYFQNEQLFDLVPLREAYQAAYPGEGGSISITIAGWDAPILYTF